MKKFKIESGQGRLRLRSSLAAAVALIRKLSTLPPLPFTNHLYLTGHLGDPLDGILCVFLVFLDCISVFPTRSLNYKLLRTGDKPDLGLYLATSVTTGHFAKEL